ncbi:unnamed protein product [Schistosoma margrebowiei]|uniref:Protein FAM78A n=1 Tax=Schistosoma margrebowiei TaxID=48269 RepID=A0AA84ZAV2_9TREM|nr:unnamed protein product [Schistosoma margrebowiei]
MSTFLLDQIHVQSIDAYYDPNSKTEIIEKPHFFKYKSQHFHCHIKLMINDDYITNHQYWTIGLVQACNEYYIENRYDNYGSTLWEFHPIKTGRHQMINDSDGNQYPFYDIFHSNYIIHHNYITNKFIQLYYKDYFYPTIAWELPYSYNNNNINRIQLTDIIRRQQFWVWLIAIKHGRNYNLINIKQNELYILNTIRWQYTLHITLDPYQPIGKRLKYINDIQYDKPIILNKNKKLPLSAINPPHCNAAQSLIWYPNNKKDQPKLIIPPKQIIVPWKQWLNDMTLNYNENIKKLKQCQFVGELLNDKKIGITNYHKNDQKLSINFVNLRSRSRG